ncbi:phosphatidate cytidylyltransferase [Pseudomonadota bacterium]
MNTENEPKKTGNSMLPRIISAAVLAPIALGAVYWGGWPYYALLGLAVIILAGEWANMVGKRVGWMALGVVYIGLSMWALWKLRVDPEWGTLTLFWLLFVVWSADTGGLLFGSALKGPKLAPNVSPNKTWSGFLGGAATSALVGWGIVWAVTHSAGWEIAALGAVVSVVSQMGDLFESFVKRRFGVKDSGTIIPGHGGLFDRVDGLVAAALAVALINIALKGNVLAWLL